MVDHERLSKVPSEESVHESFLVNTRGESDAAIAYGHSPSESPGRPQDSGTVDTVEITEKNAQYSTVLLSPGPQRENRSEIPLLQASKSRTAFNVDETGPHNMTRRGIGDQIPWAWEVSAIFLSIGALIATVALLRSQDNQPLAAWNFKTSLNTVISALGTVSRSSLAFAVSACIGQQKWNRLRTRADLVSGFGRWDEASRGPWGCLKLLFAFKHGDWAFIGAVVVIILLAFDPFLQAIVSHTGHLGATNSPQGASLGRTAYLDTGSLSRGSTYSLSAETKAGITQMEDFWTTPQFSTTAAILGGFSHSDPSVLLPRLTCTTGNCTWPIYTSLAYCSACNDVSGFVAKSQGHVDGSEEQGEASDLPISTAISMIANFTNYTLPYSHMKGFNLFNGFDGLDGFNASSASAEHLLNPWMTAAAAEDPAETMTFKHLRTMIASFAIMRTTDDFIGNKSNWRDSQPTATECAIWYCVNAYNTSSTNNIISEGLVASWADRAPGSYQPLGGADVRTTQAYAEETNGTLSFLGGDVYRSDLQLVVKDETHLELDPYCPRTFNVTQRAVLSTSNFLIKWAVQQTNEEETNLVAYPTFGATVPNMLDALWGSSNFSETFDNVARSMTLDIRQTAAVQQTGSVYAWVILIKVKWSFITLPAIAIMGGTVYVLVTLWQTSRLRMPVWKESALPALAYGLSEESRALLRSAGRDGHMDATAKTITMSVQGEGPDFGPRVV